jgi:hypothetical protein
MADYRSGISTLRDGWMIMILLLLLSSSSSSFRVVDALFVPNSIK